MRHVRCLLPLAGRICAPIAHQEARRRGTEVQADLAQDVT